MAPRPLACVMGDMDLVRPLGLAGIPCAVVAPRGAPTRFTRFARHALDWVDAWDAPGAQVDVLVRFAEAQPEPPVLYYEEDRELLLVSRFRDRLARAFRFVVADADLVEALVDKARFQELAARLDLPVPRAHVLHPEVEPCPAELAVRLPCIVKPLTRRVDRWEPVGSGAKAIRVDTLSVLRALWPLLAEARAPVLAQELVPGPETLVESYHVYVDPSGDRVADFTGRKIRTYPLQYGDSTALIITDAPDVATLGRDVVRRLGVRGVAKLDFKRRPDGRLYLLEVNPRFTLWHHPAALAGVNIPALVYGDLAGLARPAVRPARPGVRWCKPWGDAVAARASGVTFVGWLAWALRSEAWRAFAWDDPLPLVGGALWRLASRLGSRIRPGRGGTLERLAMGPEP